MYTRHTISTLAGALLFALPAHASFTIIEGIDDWNASVFGPVTTLDFVFSENQFMSDQYESLGVLFPDGDDVAYSSPGYPQDGWGVTGHWGFGGYGVTLQFLEPQYAVGAHFLGTLFVDLYWKGELIYTSPTWSTLSSFGFGGIISLQPFDKAVFWSEGGDVSIDDILFTSVIPAPAAGSVLMLGALVGGARRRRCG